MRGREVERWRGGEEERRGGGEETEEKERKRGGEEVYMWRRKSKETFIRDIYLNVDTESLLSSIIQGGPKITSQRFELIA